MVMLMIDRGSRSARSVFFAKFYQSKTSINCSDILCLNDRSVGYAKTIIRRVALGFYRLCIDLIL